MDGAAVSITLATIRQEAARRLDGSYLKSTCSGGDTSTLIDVVRLKSTLASSDDHVGQWVLWTYGTANATTTALQLANIRSVASYAPGTGTLTNDYAWASVPTATDGYELHGLLHPREWVDCINAGLRKCTRLVWNSITIVNSQKQYSLSALTSLQTDADAVKLRIRYGSTANQYDYEEVSPSLWEIDEDDDGYSLFLKFSLQNNSSTALQLQTITPYDTVLDDDTDTVNIPLDWAVAAAMMTAWERHDLQVDERGYKHLSREEVSAEFRKQCTLWSPSVSKPVHLEAF